MRTTCPTQLILLDLITIEGLTKPKLNNEYLNDCSNKQTNKQTNKQFLTNRLSVLHEDW
jgi:hypothetical protein